MPPSQQGRAVAHKRVSSDAYSAAALRRSQVYFLMLGYRAEPAWLQCLRSVEELRGGVQLVVNTDSKTLRRPGDLNIRLDAGTFKSVSLPSDVLGLRHNEHIAMAYFET